MTLQTRKLHIRSFLAQQRALVKLQNNSYIYGTTTEMHSIKDDESAKIKSKVPLAYTVGLTK